MDGVVGSSSPHCFVVVGAAGCGKSTFATEVCRVFAPVAIVDIDPCIEHLLAAGVRCADGIASDDRDSAKYKAAFREPIHEQLFSIARQQLHVAHISCVLIAPFTTERRLPDFCRWLRSKLEWLGSLHVFFLHCRPSVRMERVVNRALPRDAKKFDPSVADYWETSSDTPEHIQIAKGFDGEEGVRVRVVDVTEVARDGYGEYLRSIRDEVFKSS